VGDAGDDEAVGERPAIGNPQTTIIQKRSLALLCREELVRRGIVDDARDDLAVPLEAERDCEMRNAVQEVRGAVERIDDPSV
jgi:hypothetical protein